MKTLLLAASLLASISASAADVTFKNATPNEMRIAFFRSKCEGTPRIDEREKTGVVIPVGKEYTLKGLENAVAVYTVCGSGLCMVSAIGMNSDAQRYSVEVRLDNTGLIEEFLSPNIWPGNLNCKVKGN